MIIGIDLGTTNSLVGFFNDTEPQLIPNALGNLLTPSAIHLQDDQKAIIGAAAKNYLIDNPATTTAKFKRLMGTNQHISLGKKLFRPEELSALVMPPQNSCVQ